LEGFLTYLASQAITGESYIKQKAEQKTYNMPSER
jgi:hypothetical protein